MSCCKPGENNNFSANRKRRDRAGRGLAGPLGWTLAGRSLP